MNLTKEQKTDVIALVRNGFWARAWHEAYSRHAKQHGVPGAEVGKEWERTSEEYRKLMIAVTDALFVAFAKALHGEADAPGDLLGVDVPVDPENFPPPTCARCGGHIRAFYSYIHRVGLPENMVLLMQSYCCPHANCRAVVITMPIGQVPAGDIALPGQDRWPGMPA